MTTTIKQNQRKYLIVTSEGTTYVVNYEDINSIIQKQNLKEGYYKVYEIGLGKLKVITKKYPF